MIKIIKLNIKLRRYIQWLKEYKQKILKIYKKYKLNKIDNAKSSLKKANNIIYKLFLKKKPLF